MDRDSKSKNAPFRSLTSAVDLVHLRYAVAAADHGSFRRAAEALLLRQSTLSRCIRQLEERINMIVFERSSGGVRATSAGREFLRTARSILEQMDMLLTGAHNAGCGEAGQITIGLVERSVTRLTTSFRNGAIDIVIVTGETPLLDSKVVPLWSERIVVALPAGHRLTANETIYWTDLRSETILLSHYDPGRELE